MICALPIISACLYHLYFIKNSECQVNSQIPSAADVDAPQNLAASNIQTESAMLTWKPPRADISGYILSFESADGIVKVSEPPERTTKL